MDEVVVDSNIILRFIIRDDPEKYLQSKKFFDLVRAGKKKALVTVLVLQEVAWILEKYYKMKRADIAENLLLLTMSENVDIYDSRREVIYELLQRFPQSGLDLVDIYLHLEARRMCCQLFTYDEQLMRIGKDFVAVA